jgi:RHS repeat-associated protein
VPGATIACDNVGNMTQDNLGNTYSYDVEGRAVSSGGVQTSFDAFGRAMEQNRNGTYTQIVYSPTGQKFAFMNGATLQQYIVPMVAGMQAVYNSSGLQYYRHADWLGTSRFATKPDGTMYFDGAYAPFGENYVETGTTDRSYTGQTQDTMVGLYDFLFRQYASSEGRWLVPDPASLAAVDITNPQTWNRYAYVMNNPLGYIDPLGLYCVLNYGSEAMRTSVGCGDVGLAWGSGTFAQWVPPTTTSSTTTDPNDPTMQTFTISHTNGYWMMGLPLSSAAMYGFGDSPSVVLKPQYDKIEATQGVKEAQCHKVANAAFLTNILPGGNLVATALYKDSLTSSDLISLTQNELLEKGVEVAGASTGFKYFVRSVTGVPMSVTAKFAGWLGIALTAKDVIQSVNASIQAYQGCMQ